VSTTSAAPSDKPVAVCVDRPLLSLDRPFTYRLPLELEAGTGSLVQVPFHGKATRGWILGDTDDVPDRMLSIKKVISPVPRFDDPGLQLMRWVAERYVAPLAAVIERAVPPRVASEEASPVRAISAGPLAPSESVLATYRGGPEIVSATNGSFVLRPAPEDEVGCAVELVGACIRRSRRAIVIVPEADPLPATAVALRETFGERVALLAGGDRRARYRTWLDLAAGAHDVVVGTRPSVFAPLGDVGLLFVSRESHAAHREDRAPYYHVRDVAMERARIEGAVCVLSAICPSAEATALGIDQVVPTTRRWPPVEVVRPGPEGRAPRLVRALRSVRRAFVLAPVPGSGLAQVCRRCGRGAACATCGGALRAEEGRIRCIVCEAPGRCANCGSSDFGVRPGGRERVEEWVRRAASVPVRRYGRPRLPADGEIVVGGPAYVRDLGAGSLDLVAILDADAVGRAAGVAGRERMLARWMEAVGWARPHGRAIVQSSTPSDPAIQALVRGNPDRFHSSEATMRAEAGFPVGAAVFRVVGGDKLEGHLATLDPITLLAVASTFSTEGSEGTICLLALTPDRIREFGTMARDLAAQGIVSRVEAEPHLERGPE
jgi:primosomal protein N' (replication factor Y) (superfamily II helicase)